LADFVLVWSGGGQDDLGKSPHFARIANAVYPDHCPGDVTCSAYGFVVSEFERIITSNAFHNPLLQLLHVLCQDDQGTPSPMMETSLLFKLHSHMLRPGVKADPSKFKEVFHSKHGKVRIYKILEVSHHSKAWVERNRHCDSTGWFCPGRYPPGLKQILEKEIDFAQLDHYKDWL
jgi:dolichyl-diphosphooligosaccharide--protein glycosyltransferase